LPFLLHPDKVQNAEAVIRTGKALTLNKRAKANQAKKKEAQNPATQAGDNTMVGRLAQKLFLERMQTQQGKR
jgi:hypothetical protein